jgi:hypothetical protein
MDVAILSFARPEGVGYFPRWEEIAISVGIVAAFALVFVFVVEHFSVYPDVVRGRTPRAATGFDPATSRNLLPDPLASPRRYSAAVVAGAALALLFLPLTGRGATPVPVSAARRVAGVVGERTAQSGRSLALSVADAAAAPDPAGSPERLLLMIDADRDGDLVLFDHDDHARRLGGDAGCGTCHHLNVPYDRATRCSVCHRDMHEPTRLFDHDLHAAALGGNERCGECHRDSSAAKSEETATACMECHEGQAAASPFVAAPQPRWRPAAGFADAMHGMCRGCHTAKLRQAPASVPGDLDRCRRCHDTDRNAGLARLDPATQQRRREAADASRRERGGDGR